jgi:hypothetical protein
MAILAHGDSRHFLQQSHPNPALTKRCTHEQVFEIQRPSRPSRIVVVENCISRRLPVPLANQRKKSRVVAESIAYEIAFLNPYVLSLVLKFGKLANHRKQKRCVIGNGGTNMQHRNRWKL